MSTETNKAVVRRFFDEVFSQGKLDVVDQLFTANHMNSGPGTMPGLPNGPEGTKKFVSFYRNSFPDVHFTIDEQIAEGDTVITRWTAQGTQQGALPGIPVTGRPSKVTGITVDKFDKDGKIMGSWGIFDQFGMMQQLGVIPVQNQTME